MGSIIFGKEQGMVFLGRDIGEERNYSEETARLIDSEIKRVLQEAYDTAHKILTVNRDKLEILAQKLLDKETLDGAEVRVFLSLPELPVYDPSMA